MPPPPLTLTNFNRISFGPPTQVSLNSDSHNYGLLPKTWSSLHTNSCAVFMENGNSYFIKKADARVWVKTHRLFLCVFGSVLSRWLAFCFDSFSCSIWSLFSILFNSFHLVSIFDFVRLLSFRAVSFVRFCSSRLVPAVLFRSFCSTLRVGILLWFLFGHVFLLFGVSLFPLARTVCVGEQETRAKRRKHSSTGDLLSQPRCSREGR